MHPDYNGSMFIHKESEKCAGLRRAFRLRRVTSLLSFCILLAGGGSAAWADARVQALYGLGAAGGFFQDVDFNDKGASLESESGGGFLFDWAPSTPDIIFSGGLSNHAVSVDYYSLGEEESGQSIKADNLFVGWRYHFLSNFYLGLSLALASDIEWDCNADDGRNLSGSSRPVAYTFGYSYTFPFLLSLGVHYFSTLASDYELDEPACGREGNLEDVTFSLVGFTAGINF